MNLLLIKTKRYLISYQAHGLITYFFLALGLGTNVTQFPFETNHSIIESTITFMKSTKRFEQI